MRMPVEQLTDGPVLLTEAMKEQVCALGIITLIDTYQELQAGEWEFLWLGAEPDGYEELSVEERVKYTQELADFLLEAAKENAYKIQDMLTSYTVYRPPRSENTVSATATSADTTSTPCSDI